VCADSAPTLTTASLRPAFESVYPCSDRHRIRVRPARPANRLFEILAPVSREDVLCGAVSSHARRWGALSRPNGGLLLRVPLRGHPPSFPGPVSHNSAAAGGRRRGRRSTLSQLPTREDSHQERSEESKIPSRARATSHLFVSNHGAASNEIWAGEGGAGVLVAALQSEREEETRDRAERGSAVRGSDQASVAAKRTPTPTDRAMDFSSNRLAAEN
jgi:hypothetical protein